MEQRRTIEIGLFGALTSFQIALAALAVGQSGKPTVRAASWFAGVSSGVLWLAYLLIVLRIEQLNRQDRMLYSRYETPGAALTHPSWDVRRSWAAWPIVPATVIQAALVLVLLSLA
jgi:hypothetical protein